MTQYESPEIVYPVPVGLVFFGSAAVRLKQDWRPDPLPLAFDSIVLYEVPGTLIFIDHEPEEGAERTATTDLMAALPAKHTSGKSG